MKFSSTVSMLVLSVLLLFAGCTKQDSLSSGTLSSGVASDATAPAFNTCKIRRIYQDDNGTRVSALFSYNAAGNPFSLIYSNGGTGVYNHYFRYDAKNRLTEWRLTWGDFPLEHHYYLYTSSDQIARDSMILRNGGDGRDNYITVSTIEYDVMGRVVKETIVNIMNNSGPLSATRRPTYTYDSRGNLAVAGWKSSSYDSKINPLRQNPIFQFIMRNYSMNNAAVQPKYNSLGLPLSINPSNDMLFNHLVTFQVVYDCN